MKRSYQVKFTIKNGSEQAFIDACIKNQKETHKEEGNIRFDLIQDLKSENTFILYEVYENEEAMKAHMQTEHFNTWVEETNEIIEDREFKYWKFLE